MTPVNTNHHNNYGAEENTRSQSHWEFCKIKIDNVTKRFFSSHPILHEVLCYAGTIYIATLYFSGRHPNELSIINIFNEIAKGTPFFILESTARIYRDRLIKENNGEPRT